MRLAASTGPRRLRRAGLDLREDRGGATVFACLAAMALISVTVLGLQIGSAVVARHRAETAADLAVLAGAGRLLDGSQAACAAAELVAAANRADLESCALDGADVLLTVGVRVAIGPIMRLATARARAGPVAGWSP